MSAQQVQTAAASSPWRRVYDHVISRENTLLGVLIGFALITFAIQPRYLDWANVELILSSAAVLGIVALGEFIVIVSGAIDISTGAIAATGAVIASIAVQDGVPTFWVVVLVVAVTGALGSLNGALVAVVGLPSVVVTLATLGLIRGLLAFFFSSRVLSGGQQRFGWLWRPIVSDLPPAVFLFALLAIGLGAFTQWTQLGRDIFAVGSNEVAARIAGVGVRRTRVLTYSLAGALAGVAGILVVAQQASVQLGEAGSGFEFLAIGAVVLGGTDIFGGSGRVRGAVIGVVLLYSVYNAMVLAGIPAAWQDFVVGLLILVAVIIDTNRGRFVRREPR